MELIRHKKSHGFYQNHFLDSQNPIRFIALTLFNWFGTYKVDFSSLQLSYIYLIAQAYEVLIDDILYHFFNVSFQ